MTRRRPFKWLDLFSGSGIASLAVHHAAYLSGYQPSSIALNHNLTACRSYKLNFQQADVRCTGVDDIHPRSLYDEGEADMIWGSPSCRPWSAGRSGKIVLNDVERSHILSVIRYADALLPRLIIIENVLQFRDAGPVDSRGRPIKSRRGEIYRSALAMLEALGYRVEDNREIAANFGDATTRERLFIIARRDRKKIIWPHPTHAEHPESGLFGTPLPWVGFADFVDWSRPIPSIYGRRRRLVRNTIDRLYRGLIKFGFRLIKEGVGSEPTEFAIDQAIEPMLITLRRNCDASSLRRPIGTITAQGRHFGLAIPQLTPLSEAYAGSEFAMVEPALLPQQSGGVLRPVSRPAPTISTSGAIGLLAPVLLKVPQTVVAPDSFGYVPPIVHYQGSRFLLDLRYRMLQPYELQRAHSTPEWFVHSGKSDEQYSQIGNGIPFKLVRAIVAANLTGDADVRWLLDAPEPQRFEAAA